MCLPKAASLLGRRSHESQAFDVEVAGETIPKCSGAPHFWHGITEPGETCLATSVNGNHPTETPNPARNY